MIKGILIFAAGVYSGIYLSQNFEVPRVDEPAKIIEHFTKKVKDVTDEVKKAK